MAVNNRILILFFHPLFHKSRVNRELIASAEGMEDVTLRIMYDLYPDFHIDRGVEQDFLLKHDVIIWQHPFYWYSGPSLLKEWIDIVLEHGFAYGRKGRALEDKKVLSAITVGGNRDIYHEKGTRKHRIPDFLLPFRQTSDLCHMDYLPPFVVHGTHMLDEEGIQQAGLEYRQALELIRVDDLDVHKLSKYDYMNDYLNKS